MLFGFKVKGLCMANEQKFSLTHVEFKKSIKVKTIRKLFLFLIKTLENKN